MSPGRDDVIILLVGETEKAAAILSDSKDLLADLCSYRSYLCTTAATHAQMPNN